MKQIHSKHDKINVLALSISSFSANAEIIVFYAKLVLKKLDHSKKAQISFKKSPYHCISFLFCSSVAFARSYE